MMITGEIWYACSLLNACDKVGGDYIAQLIAVHFQFCLLQLVKVWGDGKCFVYDVL